MLAVIASSAAAASAQITIYSDNFSGSGGALNGSAVDVGGQNWQAGSAFLDNGTVNTVVAASANGQAAWLPFAPVNGTVYTATATILNTNPDWIAFGFMPALPVGGDWTATDFGVRHSNSGAHAWGFSRNNATQNDQEFFNGVNTSNNTGLGGNLADPANPITLGIVLDTTGATWTAQYFLNGVQQGGSFNLPATANTGIGGIGFSRDRNATAGTGGVISAFSLTQVPEPTTFAMLALGASLLGMRLRRNLK